MAKAVTQILNKQQKERIKQFLDLANNKEETFTLMELEGFLFGLAITPEMILPSEWMKVVFGQEYGISFLETKSRIIVIKSFFV